MAHPYPSPPYPHSDPLPVYPAHHLFTSACHILDQPPPPTLREILNAYKSKGDGDRDMLLAMLNAKSAEDQRIAALVNLHQKLLESALSSRSPPHPPSEAYSSNTSLHYQQQQQQPPPPPAHYASSPPPRQQSSMSPSTLPRLSPNASPQNLTLPSIQIVQNPRKRARSSRSPPPTGRRSADSTVSKSTTEQLPPSPPFSSPGRSTLAPELTATTMTTHSRDAMAIGSLLSSSGKQEGESDWPARTSSEREREGYQRGTKVSG